MHELKKQNNSVVHKNSFVVFIRIYLKGEEMIGKFTRW